jgi:gamma-glutamylcyclotransferase (GGCT)/AIG2-like uncharacterized protein YtfP
MNTSTYQLFVYGSLRSGFRSAAYEYLTKYFSLVGEAVVKGKLFDNGVYPVAVPTDEDVFVKGELYVLNNKNEFDWAIEQLDDYEGLNVLAGEKPLYKRDLVNVYMPGSTSEAWVYWYNGPVANMKQIDTGDLLQYLQQKNNP